MTPPKFNILDELSCFYTHPPCFASPLPRFEWNWEGGIFSQK